MALSIAASFRVRTGFARHLRGVIGSCAIVVGLLAGSPVWAANYPLELVSPRAAGTSPTAGFIAMPAGHRIFKAYPGLEYNIRAVVIGGSYPYSFALTNAPAGMSINATTGEITWPNPQANATPTITVTDAEGTQRSSAWTITVTTAGFRFVSASAGEGGNGTLASPWNTMADVDASRAPGEFVYFRTGTYNSNGIGRVSVGSPWERVEFNGSIHPMVWMAYPGESPVIDFGYRAGVDPSALIRFQPSASAPLYLDGIRAHNFRNIGFQVISGGSDYTVLRRLVIYGMIQGMDGENPAGIMTTSNYGDASQYGAIQDSEFFDLTGGGALKIYSHKKLVIEGNLFRDSDSGFDLKAHVPRFDVRDNVFQNVRNDVLFGNMNTSGTGEPASGEIRFNNINTANSTWSLDVNQDGQAAEIFIHRNTLVGPVRVRNADSADGPFHFQNNVIVNGNSGTPSGSHITLENVSDASRITRNNDLTGYPGDGIVNSSGFLTSAYSRYVGTHGHQIGESGPVPMPPSGLIVQ
jgi:hypothetical protein